MITAPDEIQGYKTTPNTSEKSRFLGKAQYAKILTVVTFWGNFRVIFNSIQIIFNLKGNLWNRRRFCK